MKYRYRMMVVSILAVSLGFLQNPVVAQQTPTQVKTQVKTLEKTLEKTQEKTQVKTDAYGPAINQLVQVVEDELQLGILTGVSVALVDGQQVVLTTGFGWADSARQIPADANTVYRVGSISKLFTALSAMQLVEQEKLDLDAPIAKSLSSLRIVDPFVDAEPVTLRQLMCHRSGLVRESPVGGYLDDSEPSISQSIASLESCVLVNPPGSKTRYSNIGVTVVGQAVAAASGLPFEQYQRNNILDPLGMDSSSWRVDQRIRDKLATGYMRVADGKGDFTFQAAPEFELGTLPAGNLYSNVTDMAKFAGMLLAGGSLGDKTIVQEESLKRMSTPQLIDGKTGFGLGFYVGEWDKYRTIRHTGAVYGFSTSIVVVPEAQIAVVVLANEDIVSGRVKRISDAAMDLLLATKTGRTIPEIPETVPMAIDQLSAFVGQYESPGYWAEFMVRGDLLLANISGQPLFVRPIGPLEFEIEGRMVHRGTLKFEQGADGKILGFVAMGQKFHRVAADPPPVPTGWRQFIGSYGPEFIPLVISLRHGHLYAMTENMVDYRLTPVNATVFAMPEGLYADEHLVFELDAVGKVHAATLANMTLRRRP